jgi:hypothetical protein
MANLLADRLRMGTCEIDHLKQVQERREWPAPMIQEIQVFIHRQTYKSKPVSPKVKSPPASAVVSQVIDSSYSARGLTSSRHIRT